MENKQTPTQHAEQPNRKRAYRNGSQLLNSYQGSRQPNDRAIFDGMATLTSSKTLHYNDGERLLTDKEPSTIAA